MNFRLSEYASHEPVSDIPHPSHRRWRFRLSLRMMMTLTILVLVCLLISKVFQAWRQGQSKEVIQKIGSGYVYYSDEMVLNSDGTYGRVEGLKIPGPAWMRNITGDDLFREVGAVRLDPSFFWRAPATDEERLRALQGIGNFPKLRQLELPWAVGKADFVAWQLLLESLQGLEVLVITIDDDNPEFSNIGARQIARCINLRYLALRDPNLTEEGLTSIATLPKLECLEISHTINRDIKMDVLAKNLSLKAVHVYGYYTSDETVERLKRLRPNFKVITHKYNKDGAFSVK